MNRFVPIADRLQPWVRRLSGFALGQGLSQALGVVGGLALLRWTTTEEYAIFTLVFSIQAALLQLSDPGFSSTVIPLSHARWAGSGTLLPLMRAVIAIRRSTLPYVLAAGLGVFLFLGHRQRWDLWIVFAAWILTGLVVVSNIWSSVWQIPMIEQGRPLLVQRFMNVVASARVCAYALLHLLGQITGIVALSLNTLLNAWLAFMCWRSGKRYLPSQTGWSGDLHSERTAVLRMATPMLPVVLFAAVQGQVMPVVVAIHSNAQSVAEVGALMRINSLFQMVGPFLSWYALPYFSKLSEGLAPRRTVQFAAVLLAISIAGTLVSAAVPWPFLLLLGRNYAHLEAQIPVVVGFGFVTFVASAMATVATSRRFIFWSAGVATIAVVTLAQVGAGAAFGVSTVEGVLFVGVAGALGYLVVNCSTCVAGFLGRSGMRW